MSGSLQNFPNFPSPYVMLREVTVWLPPDYEATRPFGYPVLYMHDGQNLFAPLAYSGTDWSIPLRFLLGRVDA